MMHDIILDSELDGLESSHVRDERIFWATGMSRCRASANNE